MDDIFIFVWNRHCWETPICHINYIWCVTGVWIHQCYNIISNRFSNPLQKSHHFRVSSSEYLGWTNVLYIEIIHWYRVKILEKSQLIPNEIFLYSILPRLHLISTQKLYSVCLQKYVHFVWRVRKILISFPLVTHWTKLFSSFSLITHQ